MSYKYLFKGYTDSCPWFFVIQSSTQKKNIDRRYETIKNGEKIHFSYLTTPNPINENVISFMNVLPREFDLHRFIDYDMQFDKAFVEPLKVVVV